ncbi:hypothetical protein A608_0959 [Helicobacter pylori CCHI 33]|nr:hypothetical protein A608_0959 [Helicobacter pylori CCHI 33]
MKPLNPHSSSMIPLVSWTNASPASACVFVKTTIVGIFQFLAKLNNSLSLSLEPY